MVEAELQDGSKYPLPEGDGSALSRTRSRAEKELGTLYSAGGGGRGGSNHTRGPNL